MFLSFLNTMLQAILNNYFTLYGYFFWYCFRIVLFSEAAIIFTAIFSIVFLGFAFGNSLVTFLYVFVGSILVAYFSGKCEKWNVILKAGFYTSLVMSFLSIIFDIFLGHELGNIPIPVRFFFS